VARNADLILLILDVFQPDQISTLRKELYEIGVRLNTRPPKITIEPSTQGGLGITTTCTLTKITEPTIRAILNIYKIHASVIIREDITDDELIDVAVGNRRYIPSLTILNKIDLVSSKYVEEARKRIGEDFVPISADQNLNIDTLKDAI
jgi:ribosome-interacting GTPase 1